MKLPKILVVGPFGSKQRDEAILKGFECCGCIANPCGYGDMLFSRNIFQRLQFRVGKGPIFRVLTNRVTSMAKAIKADVVFFRRPLEFSASMIHEMKKAHPAIYASFNNDDPFSSSYKDIRWRNSRSAIPEFDIHFAFRQRNIEQYRSAGAKKVALWEPFYTPWIHRPLVDTSVPTDRFSLLFAMHAEKDERRDALIALKQNNVPMQVHSWNWGSVFGKKDAAELGVKPPIWEDEYVKAIGEASATLCFFSKQNNDELTSRVFEIPACGGLLLSMRTARLQQIFEDEKEAFFFSSVDELVDIVRRLEKSPRTVLEVKQRGYHRLLNSRYSVVDRCADALDAIKGIM